MAKLLPHREEIIPIKNESPIVPPVIPTPAAASGPTAGPALPPRLRPREPEQVTDSPSERHCSRCGQRSLFYYDLFQLRPSHVNEEQAGRLGLGQHPWVMGIFCGQCQTYLSIHPVSPPASAAPPVFTHG